MKRSSEKMSPKTAKIVYYNPNNKESAMDIIPKDEKTETKNFNRNHDLVSIKTNQGLNNYIIRDFQIGASHDLIGSSK